MPKIQLPERKTMKPFSAFAGIGASIFVLPQAESMPKLHYSFTATILPPALAEA